MAHFKVKENRPLLFERNHKKIQKHYRWLLFDQHQVGKIISRTTTGLNQVSQVLLTGINQFLVIGDDNIFYCNVILHQYKVDITRYPIDYWECLRNPPISDGKKQTDLR